MKPTSGSRQGKVLDAWLNQQPCEQRGFPLSTVGQYLEFSGDNTCYVCIYIYLSIVCIYISCIFIYIYIFIFIVCIYTYIVCVYIYIYIYIYIVCIYIYIYRMCIYIYISSVYGYIYIYRMFLVILGKHTRTKQIGLHFVLFVFSWP